MMCDVMPSNEAQQAQEADAMRDELARLRKEVHNLNWALGTPGYEQMATPEEQAEHEAGAARVDAMLKRMEESKRKHDAMEKDAARYRWLREQCRTGPNLVQFSAGGGRHIWPCHCPQDMDEAVDSGMRLASREAVGAA